MIEDSAKNFLYLADSLCIKKFDSFRTELESVLHQLNISFNYLRKTNDIWARDYMPLQVDDNLFVQFTYLPDYLRQKKYAKLLTDVNQVCNTMQLQRLKSEIVLDGGNVVSTRTKAILTEKVFAENSQISKRTLIEKLYELLKVEEIIIIPWDKNDYTGHADGMVRFLDNQTVLCNNYAVQDNSLKNTLHDILKQHNLNIVPVPYNVYENSDTDSGIGIYLNYLQVGTKVLLPTFGLRTDEDAYSCFQKLFKEIVPIRCDEIAREGGVLNCISWPIKRD